MVLCIGNKFPLTETQFRNLEFEEYIIKISPGTYPIISRTWGFPGPAVCSQWVPQPVRVPVKLRELAHVQHQWELARLSVQFYLPGAVNEDTSPSTERKEQLILPGGILGWLDPECGSLVAGEVKAKKIYGWEMTKRMADYRRKIGRLEGERLWKVRLRRALGALVWSGWFSQQWGN